MYKVLFLLSSAPPFPDAARPRDFARAKSSATSLPDTSITTELRPRTFAAAAMAKKAKARLIHVRLISMAMTGFYYTFKRPRTAPMMGMMKYDPIVRAKVLFLETKKRTKG